MSSRIEGLPNELFDMILECVRGLYSPASHCESPTATIRHKLRPQTRGLLPLTLVSSVLKEAVERNLYSRVVLNCPRQMLLFLRSLLERPHLTHRVLQLWTSSGTFDEDVDGDIELVHSFLCKALPHITSESNGGLVNRAWEAELKQARSDSIAALILMLLPKIRVFGSLFPPTRWTESSVDFAGYPFHFHALFRFDLEEQIRYGGRSLAKTLTEVHLEGPQAIGEDTLTDLRHIAQLEHVKSISLKLDILTASMIPNFETHFAATKLHLDFGPWPENAAFEKLLAHFPSLEDMIWKLTLRAWSEPGSRYSGPIRLINDLVRMLIRVVPKLRRLTLTTPAPMDMHERNTIDIASLSAFQNLTSINVPAFDLWARTPSNDNKARPTLGKSQNLRHSHLPPLSTLIPHTSLY